MDSILSINRYSMEPQVNSTKSRVLLDSSHYKNQNDIEELYQIREVILNLVLDSTPVNHIKTKVINSQLLISLGRIFTIILNKKHF